MLYRTILLVDDDPEDREVFLLALKNVSSGTTCILSRDGQDALEKLIEMQPKPELIVLDLNMPRMSGKELLLRLKADRALMDIPVIVFSTASLPLIRSEMLALGAEKFITKPFGFARLEVILNSILNGSMEMLPEYY